MCQRTELYGLTRRKVFFQTENNTFQHVEVSLFEMNNYAVTCNLVHFEKCYIVYTDLVASGWFFQYSYLSTVIITIFFRGKLGIWGEPWCWTVQLAEGFFSFYCKWARFSRFWMNKPLAHNVQELFWSNWGSLWEKIPVKQKKMARRVLSQPAR